MPLFLLPTFLSLCNFEVSNTKDVCCTEFLILRFKAKNQALDGRNLASSNEYDERKAHYNS